MLLPVLKLTRYLKFILAATPIWLEVKIYPNIPAKKMQSIISVKPITELAR